jgi:phenylpyruvate tautomerase PptA (4-oxalocrotonate tautomerase family)
MSRNAEPSLQDMKPENWMVAPDSDVVQTRRMSRNAEPSLQDMKPENWMVAPDSDVVQE